MIIPNFFNLVFVTNTGGLFGSLKGFNVPFIFLSLIVIGVILYLYDKLVVDEITAVTYGLILAGVVGNLIDRLFLGFVVDWLDFVFFGWHYPTFNVADSCIVIGVILLFFQFIKKK